MIGNEPLRTLNEVARGKREKGMAVLTFHLPLVTGSTHFSGGSLQPQSWPPRASSLGVWGLWLSPLKGPAPLPTLFGLHVPA